MTMPVAILPFDAPSSSIEPLTSLRRGNVDEDGDLELGGNFQRTKHNIITPGETITDDPQWMRYFYSITP